MTDNQNPTKNSLYSRRVCAFIVDILAINFALFIASLFNFPNLALTLGDYIWRGVEIRISLPLNLFLIFILYFFTFEWLDSGRTLGKSICKIRTVTFNGEDLDASESFLRSFFKFLSSIFLMVGFLPVFSGYTFHEKITRTKIIKTKNKIIEPETI